MVYVGKKGDEVPPEDEMRIPPKYSGNAFGTDGVRRSYDVDGEALRHAEELFRRGYVFEDEGVLHSGGLSGGYEGAPSGVFRGGDSRDIHAGQARDGAQAVDVNEIARHPFGVPDNGISQDGLSAERSHHGESTAEVAAGVGNSGGSDEKDADKRRPRPAAARPLSGLLDGIFSRISTEEILLGAIILILLMNGSDDELLIMLVILLFC